MNPKAPTSNVLVATGTELSILGDDFDSLTGPLPVPTTPEGLVAIGVVLDKIRNGAYRFAEHPCPCGATQSDVVLARVDRYRIPHRTVLCRACGLSRTSPRLVESAYTDFYTNYYRAIYERPGDSPEGVMERQQTNARRRFKLMALHLPTRPATVLEIGCGAGWNLRPFQEAGSEVTGYDYDQEYLAAGRMRSLTLHHGGIAEALATGKTYDLVILSHVVEHFLEPAQEVLRVRGLLRPQGCLFIEVPSITKAGHPLLRYFQSAHTYSFCRQTLSDCLRGIGLTPIYIDDLVTSLWCLRPEFGSKQTQGSPDLAASIVAHLKSIRPPSPLRLIARRFRAWLPI